MFEAMLQGGINHQPGYDSNNKGSAKDDNRRKSYGKKTQKTTRGELEVDH